ncbi:hypothetical protein ACHHY8_13915 [Enterobacter cloacae complex sp. 2024EL-00215]|jgi:hypothetical protein|uniref:hypothetical protein n=1 Tax=Enterobacter TaxID=547 RepID=UPI0015DC6519|nr:hypothetical protein [Enterobacter sp. RHBSTW-00901]MBA7853573.1 hypothetical protein [Enterobacter sp. RHBSTW-00901]BBS37831.1 hypothetical protein WP5S18E01_26780 [Enterobacter cloacae]
MEKIKISNNISIFYQFSRSSSVYLASLFDANTGDYISSVMSNNKESLIKQVEAYAQLDENEQAQLRKLII